MNHKRIVTASCIGWIYWIMHDDALCRQHMCWCVFLSKRSTKYWLK